MTDNPEKQSKFKESVLERLEREGITPRSRLYWITQEYSLWAAWGASVLLGAISLAVLSFSSVYLGYSLYEATHNTFLKFLLDSLPTLWLLAFLVMIVATYFNLRRTKNGYKYPIFLVIGSSFGFSVLGGMVLHYAGGGYYLDRFLGENLTAYESRMEFEARMWQNPKAGRLIGRAKPPDAAGVIDGFVFTDINDASWQIIPEGISERERELLMAGRKVRIMVATSTDTGGEVFVVCGVFPWMLDEVPVVAKWREDRDRFVERVEERREKFKVIVEELKGGEVEKLPEQSTSSVALLEDVPVDTGPCAKLVLFRPR